MGEEKLNLCICIASHYEDNSQTTKYLNHDISERFKYLNHIINRFTSTYDIPHHIHIDTNSQKTKEYLEEKFPEYFHANGISVTVHTNLEHPYALTWMHRNFILHNLFQFTHFMYLEDDIDIPFPNFKRFLENFDVLYPEYIPSFFRVEIANNKLYYCDLQYPGPTKFKLTDIVKRGGRRFLKLPTDYQASWILPRDVIIKHIYKNIGCFMDLGFIHPTIQKELEETRWAAWGVRERAASLGIYGFGFHGYIELEENENKPKQESIVWHMGNITVFENTPEKNEKFATVDTMLEFIDA